MCVVVANWGSPRWWFRISFSNFKDRRLEQRCTAVLFGAVFVLAGSAPDCKKDLVVFETFIKNVTKNFWEKRRVGAKDFYITGAGVIMY